MAQLKTILIMRNDLSANWLAHADYVLKRGEFGVEFTENGIAKIKIGDGITQWSSLPYFSDPNANYVLGDGKSISIDANGIASIFGFADAETGAQPRKKADGSIEWIKPDTTTVEGIQTAIKGLESDMAAAQETINAIGADVAAAKTDIDTLNATVSGMYSKEEVDGLVTKVYRMMGSKGTYADLPTEGNVVGDVWNIISADPSNDIEAGENVVWNGEAWDQLGGTIDLSAYSTTEIIDEKIEAAKVIKGVSDELQISDDEKILSVLKVSVSKVDGLQTLLDGKIDKVDGMGLSTNDLTDELVQKINESAPNVIEIVKVGGVALPVTDKAVDIPLATAESAGVVKSASGENKVAVAGDGTMGVAAVNVNILTQTDGEELILYGGTSSN